MVLPSFDDFLALMGPDYAARIFTRIAAEVYSGELPTAPDELLACSFMVSRQMLQDYHTWLSRTISERAD